MHEDVLQAAIISWADWQPMPHQYRHIAQRIGSVLYHVPNGGWRSKSEAGRFKSMGVRAGWPDLCMDVAAGGYHGARLELKVGRNKPTALQKEKLVMLNKAGYYVGWVNNYDDAILFIEGYLSGKPYHPPDVLERWGHPDG